MSDIREKIAREVYEATVHAGEWERGQQATSRILALIAEAMLSEEVVEAAEKAAIWDEAGPDWEMQEFHNGRGAVEAALAAIGISTEDVQ